MGDWITSILEGVADLPLSVLAASVALLQALESSIGLGLIAPGDTVVLAAGTSIDSVERFVVLLVAVVGGSLVGESIGYVIGDRAGPRVRASRLGRRIGERAWQGAEDMLERRGGLGVAISRFLPGVHAVVPVLVGAGRMPYRRFIAWTGASAVLWACLYLGGGAAAGAAYQRYESQLGWASYGLLAVVLVWVGLSVMKARRRRRQETRPG